LAIAAATSVLIALVGFAGRRADEKAKALRKFCGAIAIGADVNDIDDRAKRAGFQADRVPLAGAKPGEVETIVRDRFGTTTRACVVRHVDGRAVTAKVVNADD
jgi:hypothetical protein